jgi:hypothetical protein
MTPPLRPPFERPQTQCSSQMRRDALRFPLGVIGRAPAFLFVPSGTPKGADGVVILDPGPGAIGNSPQREPPAGGAAHVWLAPLRRGEGRFDAPYDAPGKADGKH